MTRSLSPGCIANLTGVEVDSNGSVTLTGSEVTIPQIAGTAIARGFCNSKLDAVGNNGNMNVLGKILGVIGVNINAMKSHGGKSIA
ncbi:MAG: hypothetical protein AAFV71_10095 [Cyanobacteria bacterium J06633_8]